MKHRALLMLAALILAGCQQAPQSQDVGVWKRLDGTLGTAEQIQTAWARCEYQVVQAQYQANASASAAPIPTDPNARMMTSLFGRPQANTAPLFHACMKVEGYYRAR